MKLQLSLWRKLLSVSAVFNFDMGKLFVKDRSQNVVDPTLRQKDKCYSKQSSNFYGLKIH